MAGKDKASVAIRLQRPSRGPFFRYEFSRFARWRHRFEMAAQPILKIVSNPLVKREPVVAHQGLDLGSSSSAIGSNEVTPVMPKGCPLQVSSLNLLGQPNRGRKDLQVVSLCQYRKCLSYFDAPILQKMAKLITVDWHPISLERADYGIAKNVINIENFHFRPLRIRPQSPV